MRLAGHEISFGSRTYVMAVLNVTPDSFSGDGLAGDPTAAVARALQQQDDGADLLDVGGESTRPGAEEVSVKDEIRRVVPVIAALKEAVTIPVSIDTRKAAVAAAALAAGADLVNDVSGLTFDPDLAGVVAGAGVPVVLQHSLGTPQTMQNDPRYDDVVEEVIAGLAERLERAAAAGIAREQCFVDPGIGFGKRTEHNLALIRGLGELRRLGPPVLVGPSRKRFIGEVLGLPVEERLEGTAAAVALSIAYGADVVRVHDVKVMVRVARMADAVVRGGME
ncbi:MAG: dihydropteroate synthase [Armatimonadetes bacterium]|nr:dihydropteroate synthase [Armatimonadota bacterium]